jgi:glutaredoxin 2
MLKLYIKNNCKYCEKVLIATDICPEKILIYNLDDMYDDEKEAVLKIKGNGTVPFLIKSEIEKSPLFESEEIIKYLDTKYKLSWGPDKYSAEEISYLVEELYPEFQKGIKYYYKLYFKPSFNSIVNLDSLNITEPMEPEYLNHLAEKLDNYLTKRIDNIEKLMCYSITKNDLYIYPTLVLLRSGEELCNFKLGKITQGYLREIYRLRKQH